MKFDAYSLKGRVLPALFSMILPVIIFNHFYVSEEFSKFVGDIIGAKLFSNLTVSLILLYLLSEVGRLIGKNVFERLYFKEELYMPTTNFLLFSNSQFSSEHKIKIRQKIKHDFNISLANENGELEDQIEARKKIAEAMALIRNKLHGNKFLFQHNVESGAMRNVIGGSVLGMLFSICNIIFFTIVIKSKLAIIISSITLIVYFLFILFSKIIIDFYGKNYAKVLFREYLALK